MEILSSNTNLIFYFIISQTLLNDIRNLLFNEIDENIFWIEFEKAIGCDSVSSNNNNIDFC